MINPAQLALWLIVVGPTGVGTALLLAGRRADRHAAAISLATSALVVSLSVVLVVGRPAARVRFVANADLALAVDDLSAFIVPAIAGVTLLVLLFAAGEIKAAAGRFHGLMLLFAAAAVLTATASTLPTLLLAWEVMGAASYALIGFWWRDDYRVSAGLTAFVTTRGADLGLYLAAAAALAGGAGMALADLPAASPGWRQIVALGIVVAALGKAAQLPFSFWLSRAMEGPSPVSALLHSAAMVAMGGYLLLRAQPLLAATGWAADVVAWAGAGTAVLLGVVAVAQRDLKQLLAASTAAQLGFVVMAAGVGAISGGAAHLVAHAATKAGLFLAAGTWLSLLGTKQLGDLWGVARRWRVVGWSATVSALALAGVAPLSLWATKDLVLAAAHEHEPWLYGAGFAASALSAAYAGKVLVVLWRTKPNALDNAASVRRLSGFEKTPLVVLSLGAATAGVLALPPLGPAFGRALDGGLLAHPSTGEMVASAVVALAVILAVVRLGAPQPQWAGQWLHLERAAHTLFVRPTTRFAHYLARFDDRVLDRGTVAAAAFLLRGARWAASFDDRVLDQAVESLGGDSLRVAGGAARFDIGGIDRLVEAVAARMRAFGDLARKPQTGLLHQYYLAAVVVLAVGLMLLMTVR